MKPIRVFFIALIATLCLSGCVSLRARQIQQTTHTGDVAECRFLGDVSGTHFIDEATDLGADVILTHRMTFTFLPTKADPWKAYDCRGRYSRTQGASR